MAEPARHWGDEPLVLEALEPDQLVEAKVPFGRRRLSLGARALMWGLRLYVLFSLAVVLVRVVEVARGG